MDKKPSLIIAVVIIIFISNSGTSAYAASVAEASTTVVPTNLVNFEPLSDRAKDHHLLANEENQEQKVNSALAWAEETVQNFDGIPVVSQSAARLIMIGHGVNDFNKQIKKKYNLHLKADDSGAAVAYKIKF
jgi:hypothetical protein